MSSIQSIFGIREDRIHDAPTTVTCVAPYQFKLSAMLFEHRRVQFKIFITHRLARSLKLHQDRGSSLEFLIIMRGDNRGQLYSFTVFKMNIFHSTACPNLVLHFTVEFWFYILHFPFYILMEFCFTFYRPIFSPILQPELWSFSILHYLKKPLSGFTFYI